MSLFKHHGRLLPIGMAGQLVCVRSPIHHRYLGLGVLAASQYVLTYTNGLGGAHVYTYRP